MYLLGRKKHLTPSQAETLMKRFQRKPYLDKGEKHQLANLLNVSGKKIEKWFVDKRAQARRAGSLAKGEECSHAHTDTHTRTHSHTHTSTHTHTAHTHTRTHARTHTHTKTHRHRHTHARTQTQEKEGKEGKNHPQCCWGESVITTYYYIGHRSLKDAV